MVMCKDCKKFPDACEHWQDGKRLPKRILSNYHEHQCNSFQGKNHSGQG